MCDMIRAWADSESSALRTYVTRRIYVCDLTHAPERHDSFTCETWHIHMWDIKSNSSTGWWRCIECLISWGSLSAKEPLITRLFWTKRIQKIRHPLHFRHPIILPWTKWYLKVQVSFRKRTTNYTALLRRMALKNTAPYAFSPSCHIAMNQVQCVWVARMHMVPYFQGHPPQKSRIISGSFAKENCDLRYHLVHHESSAMRMGDMTQLFLRHDFLVGSLKLYVSFAERRLFYRALLQKRPVILRSLLVEASSAMRMGDMTHLFARHNSVRCAEWLMTHDIGNMICRTHEWVISLIYLCDMTHVFVRHDFFRCAEWLSGLCNA